MSGRAMDIPYAEVDRIAKMVPTHAQHHASTRRWRIRRRCRQAYENEPQVKELIDTAKKLEGLVRNSGVHAAGVVISPQPLTELVPLHKTKNDEIVTAYRHEGGREDGPAEDGLPRAHHAHHPRRCAASSSRRRAASSSILSEIPLDDQETYEKVFHTGLTSGVFQFESHGMRDVLRRYKPNSIEDLTALNALYRPGPDPGRHDRRLH